MPRTFPKSSAIPNLCTMARSVPRDSGDFNFPLPPEPPRLRASSSSEQISSGRPATRGESRLRLQLQFETNGLETNEENVLTLPPIPDKSRPPTAPAALRAPSRESLNTGGGGTRRSLNVQLEYSAPLQSKFAGLLETDSLTDVEFIVGENEQKIRAHKLLLAVSSPVFMKMFYGVFKCESTVKIPDCEPEAFKTLIHHIYGIPTPFPKAEEEAYIVPVLYAAHKYDVKNLQELCAEKFSSILNVWNVLSIIETADMYHLHDLSEECWQVIQINTRSVLNFNIHAIEYPMMLRIVKDDNISMDEVKLFEILNTWAENECEKEDLIPTVDNKLRRLGETIKHIRYPTMSSEDFANRVALKGLLTKEDVADIFIYICSNSSHRECMRMEYSVTPRRSSEFGPIYDEFGFSPPRSPLEAILFRQISNGANGRRSSPRSENYTPPNVNQGFNGVPPNSQHLPFAHPGPPWGNGDENVGNSGSGSYSNSNNAGGGGGPSQHNNNSPNFQPNHHFNPDRAYHQPPVYFNPDMVAPVSALNNVLPLAVPIPQAAPPPRLPQPHQPRIPAVLAHRWAAQAQQRHGHPGNPLSHLRATLESHQRQQNSITQRRLNATNTSYHNHNGNGGPAINANPNGPPGSAFRYIFNRRIGRRT